VVSANQFKRAMWAGNAIATVEVTTPVKVVSVRATEFAAAQKAGSAGAVQQLSVQAASPKTKFVEFPPSKTKSRLRIPLSFSSCPSVMPNLDAMSARDSPVCTT